MISIILHGLPAALERGITGQSFAAHGGRERLEALSRLVDAAGNRGPHLPGPVRGVVVEHRAGAQAPQAVMVAPALIGGPTADHQPGHGREPGMPEWLSLPRPNG